MFRSFFHLHVSEVRRVRGTGSSDPAVVDPILRTGDRGIPNESRRILTYLLTLNSSIVPFSDEKLMPRAMTLRLSAA